MFDSFVVLKYKKHIIGSVFLHFFMEKLKQSAKEGLHNVMELRWWRDASLVLQQLQSPALI